MSVHSTAGRWDRSGGHPAVALGAGGLTRRELLRAGMAGAAGLWLAPHLCGAASPASASASAKAVIQIWAWGGPTHIDTFDPKPDAGSDITGPLTGYLETNVPGIRIGELLPRLAKNADKFAIIRSMTHGVNAHETASYIVQTGRMPSELVYPSAGAVISRLKGFDDGYDGMLPPYIVLTEPQGRFSEAGFMGSRYKPFATGGDPSRTQFAVEGIVLQGVTEKRQRERRELLGNLNTLGHTIQGNESLDALNDAETQAYDLILGDAGKVFDLSQEPDELRTTYGKNTFGQACLMARRLVERGVKYVTINYKGWDTHKQHFQTMRRKLPEMDMGLATLLEDLSQHGLLDETIVWWGGEFGRTPRVQWDPPWNGGRNHYGRVFSTVVAGGGFQGGKVVGSTDATGEMVQDRPVYPWDLLASMYELLGISPDAKVRHPQGYEVPMWPLAQEKIESGGMLREIM